MQIAGVTLALLLCARAASAGQRPLTAEDPVPLEAGQVRLSVGLSYEDGYEEPVYGLEGNLWHLPTAKVDVGLGGVAEIQVSGGFTTLGITRRGDGPLASILEISDTRTNAPQDLLVATKIRLCREHGHVPAMALRFATKLPSAGNESGLGTDMADFSFMLLAGASSGRWRVLGNLGMGIIGDPTQVGIQHDPTLYGVAVSRAVGARSEVVAEVVGRWLPRHPRRPGSENRSNLRVGVRHALAGMRLDAGLIAGLTDIDAGIGATAGLTWVFGGVRTP